jgi:rhamnulokinase
MLSEVKGTFHMSDAEVIWTIYNSLAHRYGEIFRMIQSLAPWPIEALYVIGGGAQNKYLMDLTQKMVGVPVITGPSEATAMGNIMVQQMK